MLFLRRTLATLQAVAEGWPGRIQDGGWSMTSGRGDVGVDIRHLPCHLADFWPTACPLTYTDYIYPLYTVRLLALIYVVVQFHYTTVN